MATLATPIVKRRDWRTIVFVVLTGLFGLLVVGYCQLNPSSRISVG